MVTIEGLGFGYGRGALFKELTLGLAPGNIYGLLGVNGAGKSTLLKLMSGLLFAEDGAVRSLGRDPAAREPSFLLDVFVLAEDAQAPNMLAHDYLRARAPFYPRFDHALFDRYLREFELPSAGNLATLSHGQQKKFLLAFGLASQARLVLLDEPTNGLDIPSKSLLRRVITEALTPERLFVISTHQVRDLGTLMDPIVILHQGRVLLNCTLAEIAARVRMTQQASPPAPSEANLLFSEATVGGFWSLWRGGGDGPLDLEVLFNAVVAKPEIAEAVSAPAGGVA
jgi:ABC-2 type transport system ATP-binding protein